MAIQVGGGVTILGSVAVGGYIQQQSTEQAIKAKLDKLLNSKINDFEKKIDVQSKSLDQKIKSLETCDLLQQIVSEGEKIIVDNKNEFNLIKQDISTQIGFTKVSPDLNAEWKQEFEKKLKKVSNKIQEKINNIETYEPFGIKNKLKSSEKASNGIHIKKDWITQGTKFNQKSKDWNLVFKDKNNSVISNYNKDNLIFKFAKDIPLKYPSLDFFPIKAKDDFPAKFVIKSNASLSSICSIDVYASNDTNDQNKVFSIKKVDC